MCPRAHKWQGNGIGKVLIEQVFDWGKQGKAKYFLLESGLKNESAHHLFEHLGFQPLAVVFWRDHTDQ
jgi:GNAT superfamily N-acetyltransferase